MNTVSYCANNTEQYQDNQHFLSVITENLVTHLQLTQKINQSPDWAYVLDVATEAQKAQTEVEEYENKITNEHIQSTSA